MLFSDKQREARMRNHRIFRLRGLWYNVGFAAGGQIMQELIDAELISMGAESERSRYDARRQALLDWKP